MTHYFPQEGFKNPEWYEKVGKALAVLIHIGFFDEIEHGLHEIMLKRLTADVGPEELMVLATQYRTRIGILNDLRQYYSENWENRTEIQSRSTGEIP